MNMNVSMLRLYKHYWKQSQQSPLWKLLVAAGITGAIVKRLEGKDFYTFKLTVKAEENLPDLNSIKVQEDSAFRWEKLSRNASVSVSSSVSGLVELTASQWIECEKLYHKYLHVLVEVLTAYTNYLGSPAEDELWSSVMLLRAHIAEIKQHRQHLSLLWSNCLGLIEHSGQVSCLTGADFSASRLGEITSNAQSAMATLKNVTDALILELAAVEAKEIRESSKKLQESEDKTYSGEAD